MPRLVKHPKAKRDLLLIYVYLAERNLDADDRFLTAFDADAKRPATMPHLGPARAFRHPKLANLRSWPVSGFENYLIFYRPTDTQLQILRILHGARDIERALME